MSKNSLFKILCLILSIIIFTSACSEKTSPKKESPPVKSAEISEGNINKIQDSTMLLDLLKENSNKINFKVSRDLAQESIGSKSGTSLTKSDSYSNTNTQVDGVDEADIIKTDGNYIYHIIKNKVYITKAYPTSSASIESYIPFENDYIHEIYIDKDLLVIITSSSNSLKTIDPQRKMLENNMSNTTKVSIYNISNKKSPKLQRTVETDGYYKSSRKIGKYIYLISNKNIISNDLLKNITKENFDNKDNKQMLIPSYSDSNSNNSSEFLPFNKISYIKDISTDSYLVTTSFDITNTTSKANMSAFLGNSDEIYCSTENLYVASSKYTLYKEEKEITKDSYNTPNTVILKFALKNDSIIFKSSCEIEGSILNQFSMDEFNNTFRVATTTGQFTKNQYNNLIILDENLQKLSELTNIAPGEKIYSARFIGKRAYIVTFKNVDPLFVIDLTNSKSPKILGQLKIPGFSDYLHPYDENHIIGFGKDTVENNNRAYYLGLKMALFDVSDVTSPKQKFQEIIGDRGTDSELLYNHKALMFWKDKNLLGFPVSIAKVQQDPNTDRSINAYGNIDFQGALVYSIDKDSGFKLKLKTSHIENQNFISQDAFDKYISRLLYINDSIYAISNKVYTIYNINNFEKINTLKIN